MKNNHKPQNTALGDFYDTLKLVLAITAIAAIISLTGCVSQRKYNSLKKENRRLKTELHDTKEYYKTLLLEAQRNDKTIWNR
jgi:outer membrane murein-binding lipoprotein Lpp